MFKLFIDVLLMIFDDILMTILFTGMWWKIPLSLAVIAIIVIVVTKISKIKKIEFCKISQILRRMEK